MAVNTNGFDLNDWIKLPTVDTAVSFSKSTIAVIAGTLIVVAIFVFKPFKR